MIEKYWELLECEIKFVVCSMEDLLIMEERFDSSVLCCDDVF